MSIDIAPIELPCEITNGVYFILSNAPINGAESLKIGYSSNIRDRIKALRTAHPWPLVLVAFIESDSPDLENKLHSQFEKLKIDNSSQGGTEWFFFRDELVKFVDDLRNEKILEYTNKPKYQKYCTSCNLPDVRIVHDALRISACETCFNGKLKRFAAEYEQRKSALHRARAAMSTAVIFELPILEIAKCRAEYIKACHLFDEISTTLGMLLCLKTPADITKKFEEYLKNNDYVGLEIYAKWRRLTKDCDIRNLCEYAPTNSAVIDAERAAMEKLDGVYRELVSLMIT